MTTPTREELERENAKLRAVVDLAASLEPWHHMLHPEEVEDCRMCKVLADAGYVLSPKKKAARR